MDLKGQFIFPKELLVKKLLVRKNIKEKWLFVFILVGEQSLNKTAVSTQKWQIRIFRF